MTSIRQRMFEENEFYDYKQVKLKMYRNIKDRVSVILDFKTRVC